MKVSIHRDGKTGFISYNEQNHEIMVNHPDWDVRDKVGKYLTNEKPFIISGSNNIGDRLKINQIPNSHPQYLDMALCEMYHNTGVHVNWSHGENEGYAQIQSEDKKDKPILKSVNSDAQYEIIN